MTATLGPTTRVKARLDLVERASMGIEPSWVIEDALADEDLKVRERAAAVAAELLAPERLVELVVDPTNLAGRAAAMVALRRMNAKAVPALAVAVRGESRHGVVFCLQVLGRIRSPETLALLRQFAASRDELVAQTALESLGIQKDRESVPLLLEALGGSVWLAFSAINALGEIGDARAMVPLENLRLRDPLLAEPVEQALERIRALESRRANAAGRPAPADASSPAKLNVEAPGPH